MTVAVQIESAGNASLFGDQRFYNLLFAAARELGLSKKQAGDAASIGALSVDGVHITVSNTQIFTTSSFCLKLLRISVLRVFADFRYWPC